MSAHSGSAEIQQHVSSLTMRGDDEVRNLALIPARGGSKRVHRKNVRTMSGRPLLEWPIRTAVESGIFARVVVSTDDDEIASFARRAGAEVPFMREPELAADDTPTLLAVVDAIERLEQLGSVFDNVCCIYPSAIFATGEDLRVSYEKLKCQSQQDFIIAVVRYSHPIQRAIAVDQFGRAKFLDPSQASSRTQDLPPTWHDAGQFYWGRSTAWRMCERPMDNSLAYEMSADRVLDIDTEQDWDRAAILHAFQLFETSHSE